MSDPFVAEIRIFPFNFAPRGWAFCQGQILPISQNTALFSLLGTNYGGDGRTNFALPNLQGNAALSFGQGPGLSQYALGDTLGVQNVTLLNTELPAHRHTVNGSTDAGTSNDPTNAVWAVSGVQRGGVPLYATAAGSSPVMSPAAFTGGSALPHNNMQPYLTLNFCIALQGIFPPRG